MGIFDAPPLANAEFDVAGQTVVLYELTGALYQEHILSADALEAWAELQAKQADDELPESVQQDEESSEVDYVSRYEYGKALVDSKYTWCACALAPGYPEKSVADIEAELRLSLSSSVLNEMYEKVAELNGLGAVKKDSPDESLSTD